MPLSTNYCAHFKSILKLFVPVIFTVIFFNVESVFAQYTLKTYANHTSIEKRVVSTQHFKIVYPSSNAQFAQQVKAAVRPIFKAYANLLDYKPKDKLTLFISKNRQILSEAHALDRADDEEIWSKDQFLSCFDGLDTKWEFALRYEIAYAFQKNIESSFFGPFQAFLLSSPSSPIWSAGLPAYLSAPFLTACDIRFANKFWDIETRAQQAVQYDVYYQNIMLGRSQLHMFNKMFSADLLKGLYDIHKSFLGIKYYDFNYAFVKTFGVPYRFFYGQWKKQQFKLYNDSLASTPTFRSLENSGKTSKQDVGEAGIMKLKSEPYHSFSNVKIKPPLGIPYYFKPDDWGIAGTVQWKSPLRLHHFTFAGVLSIADIADKSFFYTSYINNSLGPRIKLSFKHYVDASTLLDMSVERSNRVALSSLWRIDALSSRYSNWYIGGMIRRLWVDYFSTPPQNKHIVFDNNQAVQTDLRLVLAWRRLKPSPYTTVHPLNGQGIRFSVTGSPGWGKQLKYMRLYSEAFALIPIVQKQRIYLYAAAALDIDEPMGADYLYFSDDGGYELPGPKIMGSASRSVQGYIRGYNYSLVGEKFAMATIEYRIPLVMSNQKLLGVFPLPNMAVAAFADGGVIGNARSPVNDDYTIYRYSVGAELKAAIGLGGYDIVFNAGVAQALNQEFGPLIYFNVGAAVPF